MDYAYRQLTDKMERRGMIFLGFALVVFVVSVVVNVGPGHGVYFTDKETTNSAYGDDPASEATRRALKESQVTSVDRNSLLNDESHTLDRPLRRHQQIYFTDEELNETKKNKEYRDFSSKVSTWKFNAPRLGEQSAAHPISTTRPLIEIGSIEP